MFKKALILTLITTFILAFGGMAFAAEGQGDIKLDVRYWYPKLDSKVQVGNGGTEINVKDDLGIDNKNFPEFRLTWGEEGQKQIRFAYTKFNYDGDKQLTKTINFNGKTYTGTTQVKSELKLDYYRLGWVQPMNDKDSPVVVNRILELKGFKVDAKLESAAENTDKSFSGVIPTIGVGIQTKNHPVNYFAEITGLPMGKYGHIYDLEAGFKVDTKDNLAVIAGYRVFEIKAKSDDDYAKFNMNGPFLNLQWKF